MRDNISPQTNARGLRLVVREVLLQLRERDVPELPVRPPHSKATETPCGPLWLSDKAIAENVRRCRCGGEDGLARRKMRHVYVPPQRVHYLPRIENQKMLSR